VQRLGDTPGDGMLIGNTHDEAAFAFHEAGNWHAVFLSFIG